MNTTPWPLSAGAFNASVRAGLLSSKTLAKADFFTGKLYLRSFGRYVCVCFAGGWISASCCTFSSQMQPTPQPLQQIYSIMRCASTRINTASRHTHTPQVFRPSCCVGLLYSFSHIHAHIQLPPTSQVTGEQDAKTSCTGPSATSNCVYVFMGAANKTRLHDKSFI